MKKIWVVGIVVLFIGVGVYPAVAVESKSSIDNKHSEDDCGCEVISNPNFIKIKGLLDRLEAYTKILLVLSKHNPEIAEKCQEISDRIITITDKYEELKTEALLDDYPIICAILGIIYTSIQSTWHLIESIGEFLLEINLIIGALFCIIFAFPTVILEIMLFFVWIWGPVFGCWELYPYI